MALNKVTYVENTTVIHAQNLNDIQDEIIENAGGISDLNADLTELSDDVTEALTEKADVIVADATGSIASFSDGAEGKAKQAVFAMNPVQSGSGDPSPSNVRPISGHTSVVAYRTGANVYDGSWAQYSGTQIKTPSRAVTVMPNTSYYVAAPSGCTISVYGSDKDGNSLGVMTTSGMMFTTTSNCVACTVYVNNYPIPSAYANDVSINYPSTDHSYHAYTGSSVTYSLGSTVYGGTLTINEDGTGTLTKTMGYVDLGTLTWLYTASTDTRPTNNFYSGGVPDMIAGASIDIVCSSYVPNLAPVGLRNVEGAVCIYQTRVYISTNSYSDTVAFKAAMNGVKLCYPLATPTTTTLTAQEVLTTLLNGSNNVWHSANGDTTIVYRADTKAYVDGLVTEDNNSIIAPIETGTTASQAYAVGKYFVLNGKFCKAKTSIASGATFTLNTNYEVTTIANELYTALH